MRFKRIQGLVSELVFDFSLADGALKKNRGQSLNSELYPPFVRCSFSDRLIFDATQYLIAPAKILPRRFKDPAAYQRQHVPGLIFDRLAPALIPNLQP
jgi:hypothetical protein